MENTIKELLNEKKTHLLQPGRIGSKAAEILTEEAKKENRNLAAYIKYLALQKAIELTKKSP